MELGKVEGLCVFCRNKELDSEYKLSNMELQSLMEIN